MAVAMIVMCGMAVIIGMAVIVVMMRVGVRAELAFEGHEGEAPRIEARQQRSRDAAPKRELGADAVAAVRGFDDGVLRVEAGEAAEAGNAETDQREGADRHHRPGDRHRFADAAHVAHVLLVMQAVDDRARAEEEQRLEESVREQVEHRRVVGADPCGEEHVTQLRAG